MHHIKIVRLKPFSVLLSLILLIAFAQCTIQKRLYNPGFHVEYKNRLRSIESSRKEDSVVDIHQTSPSRVELDHVSAQDYRETPKETDRILDTSIVVVENKTKRDTMVVYHSSEHEVKRKKKQDRLVGVGIPMLGLGLIAAGALSQATAAGASLSAILFLGAIGWLCALIAAILLIIFLVFLCIPVPDAEPKQESQTQLSRGERSVLTAILIVAGVIGLAFLFTNLN